MELQHLSHNHPLVFNEERNRGSDQKVYCSECEEEISGPRFSCGTCGFHLGKNCAMAPSEINHPFHCNHSLNLLARAPYGADLHIKCALFLYNIAEKKMEISFNG
ncbi:uncharacterized protein LOC111297613 [Durio zibethinus]|uniref:Uncharacterized protein LOC111297613 n=1 Tax=Durio zibethinus TaxID=66656 RepID=A0A6P5Z5G6_DURZI|nr:uncharacterized protein LOC111297613 [Durio zibethinus]